MGLGAFPSWVAPPLLCSDFGTLLTMKRGSRPPLFAGRKSISDPSFGCLFMSDFALLLPRFACGSFTRDGVDPPLNPPFQVTLRWFLTTPVLVGLRSIPIWAWPLKMYRFAPCSPQVGCGGCVGRIPAIAGYPPHHSDFPR